MEATHRLDETKLAQAMTLLTAEHDTNTPSRARKTLLGLFIVAVPAFVVLVVSVFLSMRPLHRPTRATLVGFMALFGMAYLLALAIPVLALLRLVICLGSYCESGDGEEAGLAGNDPGPMGHPQPVETICRAYCMLVPTVAIAFFAMVMCGGGSIVPRPRLTTARVLVGALGAMTIVSLGVLCT